MSCNMQASETNFLYYLACSLGVIYVLEQQYYRVKCVHIMLACNTNRWPNFAGSKVCEKKPGPPERVPTNGPWWYVFLWSTNIHHLCRRTFEKLRQIDIWWRHKRSFWQENLKFILHQPLLTWLRDESKTHLALARNLRNSWGTRNI